MTWGGNCCLMVFRSELAWFVGDTVLHQCQAGEVLLHPAQFCLVYPKAARDEQTVPVCVTSLPEIAIVTCSLLSV
jgi:hypothetical protein